jgi:hypothetical protein
MLENPFEYGNAHVFIRPKPGGEGFHKHKKKGSYHMKQLFILFAVFTLACGGHATADGDSVEPSDPKQDCVPAVDFSASFEIPGQYSNGQFGPPELISGSLEIVFAFTATHASPDCSVDAYIDRIGFNIMNPEHPTWCYAECGDFPGEEWSFSAISLSTSDPADEVYTPDFVGFTQLTRIGELNPSFQTHIRVGAGSTTTGYVSLEVADGEEAWIALGERSYMTFVEQVDVYDEQWDRPVYVSHVPTGQTPFSVVRPEGFDDSPLAGEVCWRGSAQRCELESGSVGCAYCNYQLALNECGQCYEDLPLYLYDCGPGTATSCACPDGTSLGVSYCSVDHVRQACEGCL